MGALRHRVGGRIAGREAGFTVDMVAAEFMAHNGWTANLLINIGIGDPAALFKRLSRLSLKLPARLSEMSVQVLSDAHVPADLFKEAMARVAGAVHIVTTDGPAGRAGFTATAVCSVTADPPTLLVCVNAGSSVGQIIAVNQVVGINTIGSEFNDLALLMGGKTGIMDRFATANWTAGKLGAPLLEGAMVGFECIADTSHVCGTHRVLFCRVMAVQLGDTALDPSLYFNRAFRGLAPA